MPKRIMKVFHDWEFLEDRGQLELISAGFVREDGQELYIVFNDFDTLAVARNDWLMENVMPSIGHTEITSHVTGTGQPVKDLVIDDDNEMCQVFARQAILKFVQDIRPEWWAWYGAYDHVALCSLFGRMIDLPDGWPMLTMDIKQLHKAAGYPQMPKQPSGLHNALEDARFNVTRYKFLTGQLGGRIYVIANSLSQFQAWKAANPEADARAIWNADMIRGLRLSKSRDTVVRLGGTTDEMERNIELATREP